MVKRFLSRELTRVHQLTKHQYSVHGLKGVQSHVGIRYCTLKHTVTPLSKSESLTLVSPQCSMFDLDMAIGQGFDETHWSCLG
jgi:hypothetical protein